MQDAAFTDGPVMADHTTTTPAVQAASELPPIPPGKDGDIVRRANFAGVCKTLRVREGRRDIAIDPGDLKALIMLIHGYTGRTGQCWASLPTLAQQLARGRSTVCRLIDVAERLGILEHKRARAGRRWLTYRWLNFHQLREFTTDDPTQQTLAFADPTEAPPSESHAELSESHAPPVGVPPGAVGVPPIVGQDAPPDAQEDKTPCAADGPPGPDALPRGAGWGFRDLPKRWTLAAGLTPGDLNDPRRVQELYRLAVERRLVSDDDDGRRLWFALCRYCFRRRGHKRNIIGWLHGVLAARKAPYWWDVISNADEDHARETIRALDHPQPAAPAVDPSAQESRDLEANRAAQLRGLAELARLHNPKGQP